MRQNKVSKSFFVFYRNKLNSLIRTVKSNYYKRKFQKCTNDMRTTWKNINNLMGNKKKRLNDEISLRDMTFSNKKDICNAFNDYFASTAKNLISKIEPSEMPYTDYLARENNSINSIFLRETDASEVSRIISSFKNKSCDLKNIPTKIYKIISTQISPILADLLDMGYLQIT